MTSYISGRLARWRTHFPSNMPFSVMGRFNFRFSGVSTALDRTVNIKEDHFPTSDLRSNSKQKTKVYDPIWNNAARIPSNVLCKDYFTAPNYEDTRNKRKISPYFSKCDVEKAIVFAGITGTVCASYPFYSV